MSADLRPHDHSLPPLDLDAADTVRGTLPIERGGLANQLGLARGEYYPTLYRELSFGSNGTVVILEGGLARLSSTSADSRTAGVIVEPDGIEAFGNGMIAYSGVVEVYVTGPVIAGDRLQVSATPGTMEAITAGSSAPAAVAITDAYGGRATVLLSNGTNFSFSLIDHGALAGLADDDHLQYLRVGDLGRLDNVLTGGTYTSSTALEAFSPTNTVDLAFDENDATIWKPNAPVCEAIMSFSSNVSFDALEMRQFAGDNITSIDIYTGSSPTGPWTYLDNAPASGRNVVSGPTLEVYQRRFYRFIGGTSQYWRLLINVPTVLTNIPRIRGIRGYNLWYQTSVSGSGTSTTTDQHVHAIGEVMVADGVSGTYYLADYPEDVTIAAYQNGLRVDVTNVLDAVSFAGTPPVGAALRFDYIVEQT